MDTGKTLSTSYDLIVQAARSEKELLFQRFNFFLAATAFLITAFALLVIEGHQYKWPLSILWLSYALNAVGLYAAVFFFIINYLGSWFAGGLTNLGRVMWKCDCDVNPQDAIDAQWPTNVREILKKFWKEDFLDLLLFGDPLSRSVGRPFKHTWIIPLGFGVFWLFTWFAILPAGNYHYASPGLGVGLLVVYLSVRLICLVRRKDSDNGNGTCKDTEAVKQEESAN